MAGEAVAGNRNTNIIKIKRGSSSRLDSLTLEQGELAVTTDTNELYVGTIAGKAQLNGGTSLDSIYPIGSIIIRDDDTDYSSWLGFTWEKVFTGKVLVGLDTSDSDFSTVGKTGGSKYLQSHSHTVNSHTHDLNGHTHSIPALSGTAASAGAHTHNVQGGANTGGSSAGLESYGSNYKNFRIISDAAYSAGAHTHSITTNSSTTGGNSDNTGSSSPGTSISGTGTSGNLQPYQVVVYWKRTA